MRLSLFAITVALLTASLALADEQRKTDRRGDDRGGPFDLKSASVAHAGRDTFRHRVTGWRPGGVKPLQLQIAMGGDSRPGYFVAKMGAKAGIYEYTRRGARRIAPARFRKHSSRSYSFTFSVEPMGLPPRYRWRWVVVTPENFAGTDKLPNRGFVTHDIATGHD